MAGFSQFVPYSIGVVAENAAIGAKEILVTPTEVTPQMNGVIKSNPQVMTTTGQDAQGKEYKVDAMTDTTVTATWLPDNSNRLSPPNVRRNTRVQLYRMGDSDTFYWRDLGLDPHLKRLETVILAFNNNPEEKGTDAVNPENCWFLEVSTHTGQATFATNKSNGEPFAFTLQINAKEGKFVFEDDDANGGNHIYLDAVNKHIQAMLSTGTEFNLDGNNIYGFAPEDITFKATNNIHMECKNYSLVASESYYCETESWMVKCPAGEFTGILKVGGLATSTANGYSGKATIDAELEVKKDFTAQANVNVTGQMHAGKVISDQPIDAPNV